ncbi:MAG: histidine kinase [Oscillospiraceae bacterium]
MKKASLKSKFVILALVIIVIPLMITNTFSVQMHRQLLSNSLKVLNYNNIAHVGITTESYVQNANELATYIIANNAIRQFLLTDPKHLSYNSKESAAAKILSTFPVSSRFISKATVFSRWGVAINSNNYSPLKISEWQKERAIELNGTLFWELEKDKDGNDCLIMCRVIRDLRDFSSQIGFIKIAINMSSLNDVLMPPKDLERISYHVVNSDGHILLSTNPVLFQVLPKEQTLYSYLLNCVASPKKERENFISAYQIEKTDWLLCSVYPNDSIIEFNRTLGMNIAVLTIICVCVCLVIAICFGNIVTKPLKQMGDLMSSVSDGDFTGKLEPGGGDELSLLAHQFNDMNKKLDFLYNEVFQNELRIKEAEFSALVSQMDPHFLYNTLDTIYWMAKSGNSEAVSTMVSNLSKLLRLSLSGNDKGHIPLATELEHISCYLAIQKIRFQEQICFELNIQENLLDYRVLKLVLQPLVENSILHGINPVGSGKITVDIFAENQCLIYQVSNTGKVINVEEINEILNTTENQKRGFALKNINDRLRLSYGKGYTLEYLHKNGVTVFRVRQPLVLLEDKTNKIDKGELNAEINDCR